MMKIGILGAALRSPQQKDGNLGCYALGYSFFEILNKIAEQQQTNFTIVSIQQIGYRGLIKRFVKIILRYSDAVADYYTSLFSHLKFTNGYYIPQKKRNVLLRSLKQCKCVFDFTAGDSFTDIYGKERFYLRTKLKSDIIASNIPLVLGSQTIGPFTDPDVEHFAVDVMSKCKYVFVRDSISKEYVEKICNVHPILTSDVAFFLPYEKKVISGDKIKVGFNPSGLLWMGGYSNDNQFGLTVDYKTFCRTIIKELLEQGYEVHLILHAYFITNLTNVYKADNDRLAVEQLHEEFPETIVAPFFSTPMEAKSYISGVDLFIGARMHATIAALSSNVPVIPFSYSRKFEGLFSSLNYPYVVEGTKLDTTQAIELTRSWIRDIEQLKKMIVECSKTIEQKNTILLENYTNVIKSLAK